LKFIEDVQKANKSDNKANSPRTITIKKELCSYIFKYINYKDNYNANNILEEKINKEWYNKNV